MSEQKVTGKPKRIPYGMMNFEHVRRDNCYYVDKTRFIEKIEDANKYFFFIRPRRFGKSLTLSMLAHYYDVNMKERFDELFGDLYIGSHPTPERNQYLILNFNFAAIHADLDNYKEAMDSYCDTNLYYFCRNYATLLSPDIQERLQRKSGAVEQLDCICTECQSLGLKIYLMIDEYDHFTNKILSHPDAFSKYREETHGEGYIRKFYDVIKDCTNKSIERLFITGVSPVTMDDLTSGFNIGSNYSLEPAFNEMTGFTEAEVRDMLTYYASVEPYNHTVDKLLTTMKPYYDNYCFAEECYGQTTMYNSNMVLYFIDKYRTGLYRLPKDMLDANIRFDYEKIRMFIRKDKEFAHDASIIQRLVQQGFITGEIKSHFPAEAIVDPNNFVSLLYYFGMVTYGGTHRGNTKLIIPNEVVREQIFAYLLANYHDNDLSFDAYELDQKAEAMAYDGDFQSFFAYIADRLRIFASQRDRQKGEAFVHGFTLALTSQCRFYRPISELDNQGGYADIFLSPLTENYKDMEHSYIIELKYAKSSDSDERLAQLFDQAKAQVNRYADSEIVRSSVKHTTLHKVVVLYRSIDMVRCEEVM